MPLRTDIPVLDPVTGEPDDLSPLPEGPTLARAERRASRWPASAPEAPTAEGFVPLDTEPGAAAPAFVPLEDGTEENDRLRSIFEASKTREPDRHAKVLSLAERFQLAPSLIESQLPLFQARAEAADFDVDRFKRENPGLMDVVTQAPQTAPVVMQDGALAKMERAFRAFGANMAQGALEGPVLSTLKGLPHLTHAVGDATWGGTLQQEVYQIARKQVEGTATPEDLARADSLEREIAGLKHDMGLLAGMLPGAAEQAPRMLSQVSARPGGPQGMQYYVALGATTGAAFGAPAAGIGALPGALLGAGLGLTYSVFAGTADEERAMFYRDAVKAGVPRAEALEHSRVLGVINGALEAAPIGKVLRVVPGLRALARLSNEDFIKKLLPNPTVKAALARAALRMQHGQVFEAATEAAQEISSVYEEERAKGGTFGDGLAQVWLNGERIREAGKMGWQAAGGMHITSPFVHLEIRSEVQEAQHAENRKLFWKALGEDAKDSPTLRSMPAAGRSILKAFQARYGVVDTVAVAAPALSEFLAKEGISQEQVAKDMPDVARQLAEAAGKPNAEVAIRTEDVAAHLAPRAGFNSLTPDIRVGENPTDREMPAVEAAAKKILEDEKKAAEEGKTQPPSPGRVVFEAVRKRLIDLGHPPGRATDIAAMWQAFSESRGARTGKDAEAYFRSKNVIFQKGEFSDLTKKEQAKVLTQEPKDLNPEDYTLYTPGEGPRPFAPMSEEALAQEKADKEAAARLAEAREAAEINPADFTTWRPGEGPPPIPIVPAGERQASGEPSAVGPSSPLSEPARRLYADLWGAEAKPTDLTEAVKAGAGAEDLILKQDVDEGHAPNWFFQSARNVEEAKQTKGDAKSWMSIISKGTKKEEIEFLGIEEWLGKQGKTIDKGRVAEFIRAHAIPVEEQILGADSTGVSAADREAARDELSNYGITADDDGSVEMGVIDRESHSTHDLDEILNYALETGELRRADAREARSLAAELALVREEYEDAEAADKAAGLVRMNEIATKINDILKGIGASVRVDSDGYFDFGGYTEDETESTLTDADEIVARIREEYGRVDANNVEELINKLQGAAGMDPTVFERYALKEGEAAKPGSYRELLFYAPGFESERFTAPVPHWTDDKLQSGRRAGKSGASGLIAHVRFAEHEIDGKRVLAIEEIQSDLHQAARNAVQSAASQIKKFWQEALGLPASQARGLKVSDLERMAQERGVPLAPRDAEKLARLKARTGYVTEAELAARLTEEHRGETEETVEHTRYIDPVTGAYCNIPGDYATPGDRAKATQVIYKKIQKEKQAVPDAPLKTTWDEFAAKRLLMWAAAEGYDQIIWPTGKSQADRYSLSDKVSKLEWQRGVSVAGRDFESKAQAKAILENLSEFTGSEAAEVVNQGTPIYYITAFDKYGRALSHEELAHPFTEEKLRGAFGTALTEKMVGSEQDAGSASGGDLEIGGEGMAFAYDKKLVSFMEKQIKKYGGKVAQTPHPGLTETRETAEFKEGVDKEALAADLRPKVQAGLARAKAEARLTGLGADDRGLIRRLEKADAALSAAGSLTAESLVELFRDIPGIDVSDSVVFGIAKDETPVWSMDFPVALRDQINEQGMSLFQKEESGKVRGYFRTDAARSFFEITTSDRNANFSTMIHETGHAFLAILESDAATGHAQSTADLETVKKWAGVKERWTKAHYEKFGQAFELYVREGKAPSTGLAEVFDRAMAWMKYIYATWRGMDVELSPDIRGVMDRLLATDVEIEAARRAFGMLPPEDTSGVMKPEEYASFKEAFEKAAEAAKGIAEKATLREWRRSLSEEYGQIKDGVERLAARENIYNVIEVLRGNKRLDGAPVDPAVRGKKLDRGWIERWGGDLTPAQRRRLNTLSVKEGGINPDHAALYFQYPDGKALVQALVAAPSREQWVRAETDARMSEKYPGFRHSQVWAQENAHRALHESGIGGAIWAGVQALARKLGADAPESARYALRLAAQRRVSEMHGFELASGVHKREEAAAAAEAAKAWKDGDVQTAYDAMRRQLLAHFTWLAVDKAKEDLRRLTSHLSDLKGTKARQRIGRAEGSYTVTDAAGTEIVVHNSYQNAIDHVLYNLGVAGPQRPQGDLAAALKAITQDGQTVVVPPDLLGGGKALDELTLAEIRDINRLVKNIEFAARQSRKLILGKKKLDFATAVRDLTDSITINFFKGIPEPTIEDANAYGLTVLAEAAKRGDWHLRKIEFLARLLDGGRTAGFAQQTIFQPMVDAEVAKARLVKEYMTELRKIYKSLTLKERLDRFSKITILDKRFTHRDVLALALNMRDPETSKRLTEGFGWDREEALAQIDRALNDDDLAAVNALGATLERLWPLIEETHRRATGAAPAKVVGEDVTLPSGRVIKGGYYPILKDYDAPGAKPRPDPGLWEDGFLTIAVGHGFTEKRGKDPTPIKVSLDLLPHHILNVIHYVTHYAAVRGVDRLTRDPRVRETIVRAVGPAAYKQIDPWLRSIARSSSEGEEALGFMERSLRHLRVGSSVVLLGLKTALSVKQLFGLFASGRDLSITETGGQNPLRGTKYLLYGLRAFLADTGRWAAQQGPNPFQAIIDRDEAFTLHRDNYDRDLRLAMQKISSGFAEFGQARRTLAEMSMALFRLFQGSVNAITWHGAKQKALEEGHPSPEEYADSVVRMTQSGGGIKDLAAVQRGNEWKKMITVMYTWWSVLYSSGREEAPVWKSSGERAGIKAAQFFWLVLGPVLAGMWASGKYDDTDDPEDLGKAVATETALFASRAVPVLGDSLSALATGKEPRGAPWLDTVFHRAPVALKHLAEGDLSTYDERKLAEAAGMALHLPTGGAYNAAEFLSRYLDGSLDEPVADLLVRNPSEMK